MIFTQYGRLTRQDSSRHNAIGTHKIIKTLLSYYDRRAYVLIIKENYKNINYFDVYMTLTS